MVHYVDVPQMAVAFKKQARCDFLFLMDLLNDKKTNSSHIAHLFQMCIEKFSKYQQLKMGNQIDKQHNWAERVIPHLFELRYRKNYSSRSLRNITPLVRSFCKEIDLLAPAHYGVSKQNPVNCEYPWEVISTNSHNPRAFAPCDYPFAIFENRYQAVFKKTLSIIEEQTK